MPAEAMEAGFSDPRLFVWRGGLWCCASAERSASDEDAQDEDSEQVLARLDDRGPGPFGMTAWRVLRVKGRHQRHWIPQVKPAPAEAGAERLQFITGCDPTSIVDEEARPVSEATPAIAVEQFDGGTPAIDFDATPGAGTGRGWLALIHEGELRDGEQYDRHRWVWFDEARILRQLSLSFVFSRERIERTAGLAPHPDGRRLLISYSVGDDEAWLATVDAGAISKLLEDAEQLAWG